MHTQSRDRELQQQQQQVKKKMALVVPEKEDEETNYTTEFRNHDDDAWYTVWVKLLGNQRLRIRYDKFSEAEDNLFHLSNFDSFQKILDFTQRFRPLSKQIQDYECRLLVNGVKVCACQHRLPDDARFYDAIIEGVQVMDHSFENGDELCNCDFILRWLHGPNAGNITVGELKDICTVQSKPEVDPAVALFVQMARERLELISGHEMVPYCPNGSDTLPTNRVGSFEPMKKQQSTKQSVPGARSHDEVLACCPDERMEDRVFKGSRNVCMILLANLDRELCPSTVAGFLYYHTQVSASVSIFPSFSSEVFTRGAIMLDSEKDFQKLCDFLTNPNHIITSSAGRPWVVSDFVVGLKKIKAAIGALDYVAVFTNDSHNRKKETSKRLEVVYAGTQEFKIASDLRDLFLEFSEHQERLHKKLALMEGSILASCNWVL